MTCANLLVDELPEHVVIGENVYPIESDFKVGILFELMMQDGTLDAEERTILALDLYFPEVEDIDPIEAFKYIIWFYKCGKEKMDAIMKVDEELVDEELVDDENTPPPEPSAPYSFEHDDAYIYAAFLQYYGIDLTTTDMHWWKFRALFRALPDDCPFVKIMGYRTARITSKMSDGEKEFLRKMKRIYRLPLSEAEQEYTNRLTEALMNGGDLTGIL